MTTFFHIFPAITFAAGYAACAYVNHMTRRAQREQDRDQS